MQRFMDFLVNRHEIDSNKDYERLTEFESDKITDLLEDFVMDLNPKLKSTTISTMLAAPELFFQMNRKIWHQKLVRRSIKRDDKDLGGKIPATDDDVRRMLSATKKARDKAIIHFLASTGSRPAGVSDPVLRMKHLVDMPHGCKGIKIYDESKDGYWAFLTPEASKALENYFSWRRTMRKEEFDENTPIFANFTKRKQRDHMDDMGIRKIVENAIYNSGIERVKTGATYDKATMKMFRKRFNGKLKMNNKVNSNIAEKLMAHKNGLDGIYLQPTREECFNEFVKAVPELTLNDIERVNAERLKLEEERTELEKMNRENLNLKSDMDWIKLEMSKMKIRINRTSKLRQK